MHLSLLEEQRDWVTETIPGVGTPNPLFGIEDRDGGHHLLVFWRGH